MVTSPGSRGCFLPPGSRGWVRGCRQIRGNKAPGVMQQNRLESRGEINHPWRQGREEEVFSSRASLHLTKPPKPQAGGESRGRIRPAVAPAVPEQSRPWTGAPMLRLSRELVFHPFPPPLASPCGRQGTELPGVIKWLSPKFMEFICE